MESKNYIPLFIPTMDISQSNHILVRNGEKSQIIQDSKNIEKSLEKLSLCSFIHIADIDSAKNCNNNIETIYRIVEKANFFKIRCSVGGGIRDLITAKNLISKGVDRIVIGTNVELIKQLDKQKTILSLDIDGEMNILTNGRTSYMLSKDLYITENICPLITNDLNNSLNGETLSNVDGVDKNRIVKLHEAISYLKDYINLIAITFHHKEGNMNGLDKELLGKISNLFKQDEFKNINVIIAGGITTYDDIVLLKSYNFIPQFGSALWKEKISIGGVISCFLNKKKLLEEHFYDFSKCESLDYNSLNELNMYNFYEDKINSTKNNDESKDLFEKEDCSFLIPTIIVDDEGIKGLVYCSLHTFIASINSKRGIFFSRSRQKIWIKGETSGDYVHIEKFCFNCDFSVITFVKQNGKFCHKPNNNSCFNEIFCYNKDSSSILLDLEKHLNSLIIQNNLNTYSEKLLNSESSINNIRNKLIEEVSELVNCGYTSKDTIINESADLIYFLICFLAKKEINLNSVFNELIIRRNNKKEKLNNSKINCKVENSSCSIINKKGKRSIKIGIPDSNFIEYLEENENRKLYMLENLQKIFNYNFAKDYENFQVKFKSREYKSIFNDNENNISYSFIVVKQKDIENLLIIGSLDYVFCYNDKIPNIILPVLFSFNEKNSDIWLICRNQDYEEYDLVLNKKRKVDKKLRIMSEYDIIFKYIEENELNDSLKVIKMNGKTESYLINELCEMIVCVVQTGKTLDLNNLKKIRLIKSSVLNFYQNNFNSL